MKNVIYYFSGTGNSMRAARVIAKMLGDTEIISMRCDPVTVPAIGYELKQADLELLKKVSKRTPVVRIMGLPKKRKLYRNPYITAADMAKDRESI